jgi:hypothetical protein
LLQRAILVLTDAIMTISLPIPFGAACADDVNINSQLIDSILAK